MTGFTEEWLAEYQGRAVARRPAPPQTPEAAPEPTRLIFVLPAPPSVNALYANVAGKGRVKTGVYRAWIKEAGQSLAVQRGGPGAGTIRGAFKATIHLTGHGDLDGRLKATFDFFQTTRVTENDKNLRELHVFMLEGKRNVVEAVLERLDPIPAGAARQRAA